MISSKQINNIQFCSSCYFRSIAIPPHRKAIIQITEKCNMKCKHCFVSSSSRGREITYETIQTIILPHLLKNKVNKVTLTGGEPFVHNELLKIVRLLAENNIAISICTNASLITKEVVDEISVYNSLHFNISLDGFSHLSHGKFRGNEDPRAFQKIIKNIALLGDRGLLNGILVTPNIYSNINEYEKICIFAKEYNAKYVLMNPLSKFGRGEDSTNIAFTNTEMNKLREATKKYCSEDFEVIYIRFPNDSKPLGECVAGQIFYIFSNGDVTICPYMVFAAKNNNSKYTFNKFIIGNIFESDFNLQDSLNSYILPKDSNDGKCAKCNNDKCGKGCLAAKIANGLYLYDADEDLCPFSKKLR